MNDETLERDQVKILVVEDSSIQAEELKYILERHGFAVLTASNGKDALLALEGGSAGCHNQRHRHAGNGRE